MDKIKIIHISDLHISEHLMTGASSHYKLPHRYGHDLQAFLALDSFLKENDWDLLLITGDISRIGNRESFEQARNWIQNTIHYGAHSLGLNLSKDDRKEYVIIPGNHDRFNGNLTQGSLDKYHQEFPVVKSGTTNSFYFGVNRVNVYLYDSTAANNTFAFGELDEGCMIPKVIGSDLDIAVLHHHFIQPPKHKREPTTELTNSADVAAYFLNNKFDGIFFGHTHRSYIGHPSVKSLSSILNDKRKLKRLWKRILPKYILRKLDNDCLVSYKRAASKNGQLPTLETYFNYLYLTKKGAKLLGPEHFDSIRQFYSSLDASLKDKDFKQELEELKKNRVLISQAPSACQAESEWKGFHEIIFTKLEEGGYSPTWDRYQFNGAQFVKINREEHVS